MVLGNVNDTTHLAGWAGNARVFAEDDLLFVADELGLEHSHKQKEGRPR